jgi:hypothetical protein
VRGKSWCWGDRAVLEKEVTGRGMSDLSESGGTGEQFVRGRSARGGMSDSRDGGHRS